MVKPKSKAKAWKSAAARRLVELSGERSVERAIVKIVRALLIDVPHPPTDLVALQSKLKVVRTCAEDLPFSGELRPADDGFVIVVAKQLSRGRRRFTVAHELGHALIATTGKNYPKAGKEVERLCDMLAAEILMPEDLFLESLPAEVDLSTIQTLTQTFDTSWRACAIRCASFRRISVFEADSKEIHWSTVLTKKGPVLALDGELQCVIKKAIEGVNGRDTIHLAGRNSVNEWSVDFSPISDRVRVLLQPMI
jgi:Zn-dependent peptidase ImmA (M78 family)